MQASVLTAIETLVERTVDDPVVGAFDVLVRPEAVGICGSDVHIFRGEANWNLDATGRAIPLSTHPQILGHEIAGVVVDVGANVTATKAGDRVVLDQGLNCASKRRTPWCEYCASGYSHHCAYYTEHGITGLPGGCAELIAIPEVNAVPIRSALPAACAAMTEPLACVLHSLALMESLGGRFHFDALPNETRVDAVVICGAGPAGQFFVRAIRSLLGFQGELIISDPDEDKLAVAAAAGATPVVLGGGESLIDAVMRLTNGRRCELLIDACGAAAAWADFARLIRTQGTAILYGFGTERGSHGSLDHLQWRGASLVATCGASGPLDAAGKPVLYAEALHAIESNRIDVAPLITHRYATFDALPKALGDDPSTPGYLKGVFTPHSRSDEKDG